MRTIKFEIFEEWILVWYSRFERSIPLKHWILSPRQWHLQLQGLPIVPVLINCMCNIIWIFGGNKTIIWRICIWLQLKSSLLGKNTKHKLSTSKQSETRWISNAFVFGWERWCIYYAKRRRNLRNGQILLKAHHSAYPFLSCSFFFFECFLWWG